MNVKRKNTAKRVLTCAERKRLTDFFMLLAHIDRRMTREGKKARPQAQKGQLSTKQKTRLNYEDKKARIFGGPCFLPAISLSWNQRKINPQQASMHHDRHYRSAFNHRSISHHQSPAVYAVC